MRYEAVNREQLVQRLGARCSPDPSREGYIIGPDVTGRLCHIASCRSLAEAFKRASELNATPEAR